MAVDDTLANIWKYLAPGMGASPAFPEQMAGANYPFSGDPQGEARRQLMIREHLARLMQGMGREDPLNNWLSNLYQYNQTNPLLDSGLSGGLRPLEIGGGPLGFLSRSYTDI